QMMALVRPDGVLLEANAPAQREFGIDAVQSIGRPILKVLEEAGFTRRERLARFADGLRHAARGHFVRSRFDCQCRSGRLALDCSLNPIQDDDGRVTMVVIEARDITALRSAEMAQKDSEERFQLMFERAPI